MKMKTILRKKGNIGFTIVTNNLINNTELSLKAIGLYVYMYSKPDNWNFTIRSMASQMKDGYDSIQSGLKELKDVGYISYKKNTDGSGDYFIHTSPFCDDENDIQEPKVKKKTKTINNHDDIRIELVKDIEWLDKKAWAEWVNYKIESKKPLKLSTAKKQINMLWANKINHKKIIEKSIMNGWTGLFKIQEAYSKKEPEEGSLGWYEMQKTDTFDVQAEET